MKKKSCKYTPRSWISLGIVFLFLTACNTEYPESCPIYNPDFDLSDAEIYPADDSLPWENSGPTYNARRKQLGTSAVY